MRPKLRELDLADIDRLPLCIIVSQNTLKQHGNPDLQATFFMALPGSHIAVMIGNRVCWDDRYAEDTVENLHVYHYAHSISRPLRVKKR